jgi:uncharacterized protein
MKRITTLVNFMLIFFTALAQEKSTPLNSSEPLEVVKQFLTAYASGDHTKFASLIHPEVIWIQPGDNRISGVKTSKTELLQMGAKMAELSAGTIKLTDVKYFSANGNTVVCILHWKGVQPPGGILDVDNIDVYTVEGDKIIMAKIFSQDIEQENRFWGNK